MRDLVVALVVLFPWQRDFSTVEQQKWAGHSNVVVSAFGVWQVLPWLEFAAVEKERKEK